MGNVDVVSNREMLILPSSLVVQVKKLNTIVDDLARNYNDDLLNMFRLE